MAACSLRASAMRRSCTRPSHAAVTWNQSFRGEPPGPYAVGVIVVAPLQLVLELPAVEGRIAFKPA
jgi:hypothetical protein